MEPGPAVDVTRVTVACTGGTHTLRMRRGRVELLDHDDASLARERALAALGATPAGCLGALDAWRLGQVGDLPDGWAALHGLVRQAIADGDAELVTELLDEGVDLRTPDRHGRTLLHVAGRLPEPVVRRLIESGLSAAAADRSGQTPLLQVAASGPEWLAGVLLEQGDGVDVIDPQGRCPLVVAAQHNQFGVMHRILDAAPERAFVPWRRPRREVGEVDTVERSPSAARRTGAVLAKQDRAATSTMLLRLAAEAGDADLVAKLVGIGLLVTPELVVMAESSWDPTVHRVLIAHADRPTLEEAGRRRDRVELFQRARADDLVFGLESDDGS